MRDPLTRTDRAPPTGKPRLPRLPHSASVEELRKLAWKHQGVLSIEVDRVDDELINALLTQLGTQLYGERLR